MTGKWHLSIDIVCRSFEGLQADAKDILKNVTSARTYRDICTMCGADSDGGSRSVQLESPIEERIKHLRREADELEAKYAATHTPM
jgi:hypothetical protein